MVIDSEADGAPHALGPRIQWNTKAEQQQSQPAGQCPVQEMLMVREYTPTDLIDKRETMSNITTHLALWQHQLGAQGWGRVGRGEEEGSRYSFP